MNVIAPAYNNELAFSFTNLQILASESLPPSRQQISDNEYHYVYSGNGVHKNASHTSHMCSWQRIHKQCRNDGERWSLEVPHLPSNRREHAEAMIPGLPVVVKRMRTIKAI
jgi:hypothetical protein